MSELGNNPPESLPLRLFICQCCGKDATFVEEEKHPTHIVTYLNCTNPACVAFNKGLIKTPVPNEHSQEGVLEIVKKAICDGLDERKLNVGGVPLSRRVCCENIARDAIQAYLAATSKPLPVGWQDISSAPKDVDIYTYGYLLRYGDENQKGGNEINYHDCIDSTTVYPLRRTDYNNQGDTYVRTHWRYPIAPPALNSEGE